MAKKQTSVAHINFIAVGALAIFNLLLVVGQEKGSPPILLPQCDCVNYLTGSRCDSEAFWKVRDF